MFSFNIKSCVITGVIVSAAISGCAAGQLNDDDTISDQVRRASEYAQSRNGCALTDGYQCESADYENFNSAEAQASMISGVLFQAWQVAWAHLRSSPQLTEAQRELKHYKSGIAETPAYYLVRFQGLLLPAITEQQEVAGLIRSRLGVSVEYRINKTMLSIEKITFDK